MSPSIHEMAKGVGIGVSRRFLTVFMPWRAEVCPNSEHLNQPLKLLAEISGAQGHSLRLSRSGPGPPTPW